MLISRWRRVFGGPSAAPLASAGIAFALLFLVWVLFPWGSVPSSPRLSTPAAIFSRTNQPALLAALGALKAQCSKAAAPTLPTTQFVVVLDAGSTGSRVHVYRFSYCHSIGVPKLESEVLETVKPGLSAYSSSPSEAANSIRVLMDVALASVPEGLHGCTPVSLKATAGLRLLGLAKSEAVLSAVRRMLVDDYPFALAGDNAVEILDGAAEGVFAWITVNFLLGRLGQSTKRPTVATMDLGGGSTQIVFQPEFPQGGGMEAGEHRYELEFGGHHYLLYQHSYLGYGLMEARRRIKQAAVDRFIGAGGTAKGGTTAVGCACVRRFAKQSFSDASATWTIEGTAEGMSGCHRMIQSVLFLQHDGCQLKPCSFAGVYQPPLTSTFPHGDVYAFSYIFDRVMPLLRGSRLVAAEAYDATFTLKQLKEMTEWVCGRDDGDTTLSGPWSIGMQTADQRQVLKNADYCLDLTYTYALLSDGYALTAEREVRTAKKVDSVETSWCLGAAIAMLDGGHMCHVGILGDEQTM